MKILRALTLLPLLLSAPSLSFAQSSIGITTFTQGYLAQGGTITLNYTIQNNSGLNLTDLRFLPSPGASVKSLGSTCTSTLSNGANCRLLLSYQAPAVTGTLPAFLTACALNDALCATANASNRPDIQITSSRYALVANQTSNNISVIQNSTNSVVSTITVDNGPIKIIVSPDGSRAFSLNSVTDTVSIINLISKTVVGSINIGGGANLFDINLSPDGGKLYLTDLGTNNIQIYNLKTNSLETPIALAPGPNRIVFLTDASKAFVSRPAANSVTAVDTTTKNTSNIVLPGATNPLRLIGNPDNTRIYVANTVSDNVSVINASGNSFITNIAVGTQPNSLAINPDGSRLYVTNSGSDNVSVINTANNTVAATVNVGGQPENIAILPDGSKVYVANINGNSISVINTTTNTVTATINVPDAGPIVIDPTGTRAYVTNSGTNNVSVINTSTDSVISTVTVGSGPTDIALTR